MGEAGLGSRLFNVYPSFCTLWVVTNSKDLKMKPAERRHHLRASVWPPYHHRLRQTTRGSSGRCTHWRLGTNFSPAASTLLVQVSVLIASSTVIFPVLRECYSGQHVCCGKHLYRVGFAYFGNIPPPWEGGGLHPSPQNPHPSAQRCGTLAPLSWHSPPWWARWVLRGSGQTACEHHR